MDPSNSAVLFGVALVPVITGLTEAAKRAGMDSKYAPLLSVALGILGGIAILLSQHGTNLFQAIVVGIGLGLSAAGLYSGGLTVKNELFAPTSPASPIITSATDATKGV